MRPEQVAAFREQGELSLEAADAWLAALSESRAGGLAASLRAMSLPALVDDLFAAGAVADQLDTPQSQAELWEHFQVATGMPATWRDSFVTATGPKAEDTLFSSGAWALCVEYVQDLKRPPIDERLKVALDLPSRLVEACRGLADHLRDRYPKFYESIAEETQAWLADEVDAARAEDLGRTDTFRDPMQVSANLDYAWRSHRGAVRQGGAARHLAALSGWGRDDPPGQLRAHSVCRPALALRGGYSAYRRGGGAVGLAAAIDYLERLDREAAEQHEQALLAYAAARLRELPGLRILGVASHKAAVISFVMADVHAHDLGTVLDRRGGRGACRPPLRHAADGILWASRHHPRLPGLLQHSGGGRPAGGGRRLCAAGVGMSDEYGDLRDLYQELILDHSRHPANFRGMPNASRSVEGDNPLCGDRLRLYVCLEGERIADISDPPPTFATFGP